MPPYIVLSIFINQVNRFEHKTAEPPTTKGNCNGWDTKYPKDQIVLAHITEQESTTELT